VAFFLKKSATEGTKGTKEKVFVPFVANFLPFIEKGYAVKL